MIRRPRDIIGGKRPIGDAALGVLETYIREMRDIGPLLTILRENRILRKIFEDMMPEFMDTQTFYGDLERELGESKEDVIIYSPFTYSDRVKKFSEILKKCIRRGLRVRIITRPLTDSSVKYKDDHKANIESLKQLGAEVYLRSNFHVKLVVVDNKISYVGGVNTLSSKTDTVDVMFKLKNEDFAGVLLEKAGLPKPEERF
jgi:sugar-specific transcriptional regulator TrmB